MKHNSWKNEKGTEKCTGKTWHMFCFIYWYQEVREKE